MAGVLLASYAIVTSLIFVAISRLQPTPYMDEVLHIPQAQNYCNFNFEWHDRITTPPGMYVTSLSVLVPLSKLLDSDQCQPWKLRLTNLVFSVGSMYLLSKIIGALHPDYVGPRTAVSALNLSLLPVLYFFVFLYYTEIGSAFFVFAAYLQHLRGHETKAAILGALAVTFRQTNIVWVFFMACEAVADILDSQLYDKKIEDAACKNSLQHLLNVFTELAVMVTRRRKMFVKLTKEILDRCACYLCVGVGFIVFVYLNDGVVLGHREDHAVAFHLPQIFYLLAFVCFFGSSFLLTKSSFSKFVEYCRSKPLATAVWLMSMAIILRYFFYDHWFLNDERHLVVVIWRRLLRKECLKFCYIPLYFFSGWAVLDHFQHKGALWKLVYCFCASASVIFEALFELRYFVMAFIFFRLHIRIGTWLQLLVELLLYVLVNCVMIYLFLEPEYEPVFENGKRFMW